MPALRLRGSPAGHRRLAHEPVGWRTTTLLLSLRRYRCAVCGHVWRHTRRDDTLVTVDIDLTPVRDKTGPSRLLAMAEGRSEQAFTTWLASRSRPCRDGLEVVAMDPFHVVRLAGDALDRWRRRVQQDLHGNRGRKDDPLYRARRTLHAGADLLTDRQRQRLTALFGVEDHVAVEATWGGYQRTIGAYRHLDRTAGDRR